MLVSVSYILIYKNTNAESTSFTISTKVSLFVITTLNSDSQFRGLLVGIMVGITDGEKTPCQRHDCHLFNHSTARKRLKYPKTCQLSNQQRKLFNISTLLKISQVLEIYKLIIRVFASSPRFPNTRRYNKLCGIIAATRATTTV